MRQNQIESLRALASLAEAMKTSPESQDRVLSGLASMSKGKGPAEDTWTPDRAATEHHLRQASLLWKIGENDPPRCL
jgi:hypothetical protein